MLKYRRSGPGDVLGNLVIMHRFEAVQELHELGSDRVIGPSDLGHPDCGPTLGGTDRALIVALAMPHGEESTRRS